MAAAGHLDSLATKGYCRPRQVRPEVSVALILIAIVSLGKLSLSWSNDLFDCANNDKLIDELTSTNRWHLLG